MSNIKIGMHEIQVPIIQGGMGVGVSLGNLAGHVALNGGMGVVSTAHPGYREDDFNKNTNAANVRGLKAEIKKAKEISNGNGMVAINAMVAIKTYEEMTLTAIEAGVDAIISGAGLPLHLPKYTKDTNVAIAPIVSSGKAAQIILKTWHKKYQTTADFVVIEGVKAGGHLGFNKQDILNDQCLDLETILSEVLPVVKQYEELYEHTIPVFVAGGVYTSTDIKKYLGLGASGVQMATRFIATEECDASQEYKEAFVQSTKADIDLVRSPVGMPGRAIETELTRRLGRLKLGESLGVKKCYNCLIPCDVRTTPYCISEALIQAVKGNLQEGLIFSGSNGYKIEKIVSVKQLIDELMEEIK